MLECRGSVLLRASPLLPRFLIAAVLVLACGGPCAAQTSVFHEDFWSTDGVVHTMKLVGSTLYIGGGFTTVHPPSTGGAPFDIRSGELRLGFPRVKGTIQAIVQDGDGGFFIGGDFVSVGGQPRAGLAHILADLSVSPWNPGLGGRVMALALDAHTLYVSGCLGAGCELLASVDARSGERLGWNPVVDGSVSVITVGRDQVYLAGSFTKLNGEYRFDLGAVDRLTGATTRWNPSYVHHGDFFVRAIAESGNAVYVGGTFYGELGKARRRNLAAFDVVTGLATPWDPSFEGGIFGLVATPTAIYVGGRFSFIGGAARENLAALDPTTALALGWAPEPNDRVLGLVLDGTTLYVQGLFTDIHGAARHHLAAIDIVNGNLTPWSPREPEATDDMAVGKDMVYLTGPGISRVGGMVRNCVAGLDARTGVPLPWNPNVGGEVQAIEVDRGVVYIGGGFSSVGGRPHPTLAAVSQVTGELLPWDPQPNGGIWSMAIFNHTLYVGGDFTTIVGQPRRRLAAFRGMKPQLLPWAPDANSTVRAMALGPRVLYVGGDFTTIGGQPRSRLAAVDPATGRPTWWRPEADQAVVAIDVSGSTVYVGGVFEGVGGAHRDYIAAIDAMSGVATSWNPKLNDYVFSIKVAGPNVYAGGFLSPGIVALDAVTGEKLSWSDASASYVWTFVVTPDLIYAGGLFYSFNAAVGLNVLTPPAAGPRSGLQAGPRDLFRAIAISGNLPTLHLTLAERAPVQLMIFDVAGRHVATLVDGVLESGEHDVQWNPGSGEPGNPAGIYFARMEVHGHRSTAKVLRLR